MRVGRNPLSSADAKQFEKIVFAAVTHLPGLENEYHRDRLEVVQTCLRSMRDNAHLPHTFMIWDNGSCNELLSWIQYEFRPDVFIASTNIGKTAARASVIKMLPPGSIVAYSDDDIYYYPDWLEPQLELLEHFPNVSVVSGYPVRTAFRWGCEHTIKWAAKNGKLQKGKFIPREWENDFCISIGRDPQWHVGYTEKDVDYLMEYKGQKAYCTAHHCQFVGYADKIKTRLFYDSKAMGDEKPFDIAMDKAGLRLSTTQRYARHIGNKLDESLKREMVAYA